MRQSHRRCSPRTRPSVRCLAQPEELKNRTLTRLYNERPTLARQRPPRPRRSCLRRLRLARQPHPRRNPRPPPRPQPPAPPPNPEAFLRLAEYWRRLAHNRYRNAESGLWSLTTNDRNSQPMYRTADQVSRTLHARKSSWVYRAPGNMCPKADFRCVMCPGFDA